jgi:3-deoxy-D-manno-octulosonate 8-phosphate phosphatase (KDO 8-P phosphatase)
MLSANEKAKLIKLFIFDVDGVLTDGTLYYGNRNIEVKGFHIHDGLGIKLLQQTGIKVAVISGKKSAAVIKRLAELHIQHTYLGYNDKLPAYEDLKQCLQMQDQEIAYMGDDLPDLPLLRRAGLAITVPQAPALIREHADLITKAQAGFGAAREACEFVMHSQNQFQSVIASYLV